MHFLYRYHHHLSKERASQTTTEVKQYWARSVLGWETVWELQAWVTFFTLIELDLPQGA